jgi:hypothetical protein
MAFVGGLALFLMVPAFMQLQADSFRDLYLGRWIAAHGIPRHEVWAIANRGGSWTDQQWLSDLFGYEIWRLAGYQGLAVLDALSSASAYAILAGVMRRRGASVPLAISFASFAMVSVFTLVFIRAQSLALPMFALLLWLCVADAEADRIRWPVILIVPLLVLWANVHGSVILGAAMAAGYLLYRAGRLVVRGRLRAAAGYAGLAVASILSVLATPYGIGIFHYYREFVGNGALGAADLEWDPPRFPALSFFQFSLPLALAAISGLLAWRRTRRRPLPIDLWAVGLTALAAAFAMRNNVWLGFAAAMVIANTAGDWIPTQPPRSAFLRLATLAAVTLAAVGIARLAAESNVRYDALAPRREIAATAFYASSHPCARVLADIVSVSALLWQDPWLQGRVYFDGRIEAYRPQALFTWVAFQAADGPHALDAARGYQLLLGSSRSPMLVRELSRLKDGLVLSRDRRGIAVVNRAAPGARCANRTPAS